MMKLSGYILATMGALAWGADEVASYAEGLEQPREDGWVLLCHSADWDETHDEQWMRRQTALRSACGNALLLHVPVYQNPTPEQAEKLAEMLRGASLNLQSLPSVPCAVLLDRDGRPYMTISGDDFMERAAGMIRQAQAQLRTRNRLLERAAEEEGSQKAQTLSSICRLSIAPPPNLQEQIHQADPEDSAGIAEWSPFDPWALAKRIRTMPWSEAIAELDRIQQAQLSKEERQAVLAIRMGCVRHHLGAAGVQELNRLANACTSLAPNTPLSKAAQRAAALWGQKLELGRGWAAGQLPRVAAECEITHVGTLAREGEFHIGVVPTKGQDPVRVTRATLYDGDAKISEDIHTCCVKVGEEPVENEYILLVRSAPAHPRLVITFDQQGHNDTQGVFSVRYFTEDGIEVVKKDKARAAAEKARQELEDREFDASEKPEAYRLDNSTGGKSHEPAPQAKP